jgi:hypothetical protein
MRNKLDGFAALLGIQSYYIYLQLVKVSDK